jgi:hypothetical protein
MGAVDPFGPVAGTSHVAVGWQSLSFLGCLCLLLCLVLGPCVLVLSNTCNLRISAVLTVPLCCWPWQSVAWAVSNHPMVPAWCLFFFGRALTAQVPV